MKTKIKDFLLLGLFALASIGLQAQNPEKVDSPIPRPEYPRPQFERSDWVNLNGTWTYAFDFGKSGRDRGFQKSDGFDKKIRVPFCPESELSGVGHKDFIETMWYHKTVKIPANWDGRRILLNFGAVDYESEVFVDGKSVGTHWGGSSSFSHDITSFVKAGQEHDVVVYVRDENRSGNQPVGKQCTSFGSRGCFYTRTTGIWQTVWMEAVNTAGLRDCNITPDYDNNRFIFRPRFRSIQQGNKFRVSVFDGKRLVGKREIQASNTAYCDIRLRKAKSWSPESPFLYDIVLEVIDRKGNVLDKVNSYAGMRKIHIEGNRVFLNNKPYYQRLVLDQGFYPKGVWTAPSDDALKRDIELSMAAGFNGARLHQKVFEERFHYWADKLGYLTWGESANWGLSHNSTEAARNFLSEWEEIVVRDRNHPSIVTWTPFNETWVSGESRQYNRFAIDVFDLTHNLDPTRPINDASGWRHVVTDIWTVHPYDQDPESLRKKLSVRADGGVYKHHGDKEPPYAGQPYIIDEYGGIKWVPKSKRKDSASNSWGYGNDPKTEEEFFTRLEGLTDVILSFDHIWGYCYTQLTDVEQEQNGVYNFDRTPKFENMERIKKIFSKTPKELTN
ncbi:beta-glucuronidase (plasmid) [Fulvitalea axinellae]|uniref:Beta-glucuronidase n=1 Tax=Fulvitalea axinellae TaxID=1182444 RepID=A0AAU9DNN5_9BACT|nr:beta-glucuronidase [Fulvitalea axinellae]